MATCDISPSHLHGAHLGSCPWCYRRDRLGIDAYPNNRLAAPTPGRRPLPDPGPALPSFRGSLAAMMRQLPLTSLLLLVAGLAAGTVAASQLRGLAALRGWGPAPMLALVAGALLLPAAIAIGIIYFRTHASPVVFRTLSPRRTAGSGRTRRYPAGAGHQPRHRGADRPRFGPGRGLVAATQPVGDRLFRAVAVAAHEALTAAPHHPVTGVRVW